MSEPSEVLEPRTVCPKCGRAVHRIPSGPDGERLLTLQPLAVGYTFAEHRCPRPGTRWPLLATDN